ncbi:MAG: 2-oxo acid dehydrogenase subunit E2 [Gammaproteobacteria bacterium]|nr:2-oxo acid dehydrogenase subunit E2 [Gammaproteobacteria bacterium]
MSQYIFNLPDLGEGLVEAEIAEWAVKVGEFVTEEDPIGAMLTDKAAVELSAPVSGHVVSLAGKVGDTIAVGAPMIVFETQGDEQAGSDEPVSTPAETEASPQPVVTPPVVDNPPTQAQPGKVLTSPSVRQQAREADIDLTRIKGSGPRGRILKSDLEAHLAKSVQTSASPVPQTKSVEDITEIKVIGLRRIIAERMSEANREIPHFAYVEEIDITALESLRQHLNSKKAPAEDKLTLLPFIGLALTRVLVQFPQCNALYNRERNIISQYRAVHLGIAAQTPDGLKVPVVKNSESRSLNDLAGEMRRVSAAARANTATREELMGSTITITSLGKQGGIVTTPVINLPEVAIIGVNKAVERPVVVDGQIAIRRMMNLSSSFDHRFVDGYDAATMIQALKEMLEYPATIFITE